MTKYNVEVYINSNIVVFVHESKYSDLEKATMEFKTELFESERYYHSSENRIVGIDTKKIIGFSLTRQI